MRSATCPALPKPCDNGTPGREAMRHPIRAAFTLCSCGWQRVPFAWPGPCFVCLCEGVLETSTLSLQIERSESECPSSTVFVLNCAAART